MKNKASVFRILVTCFIVLSCVCTFLPVLTVKSFGVEVAASFKDLLDPDSLYDIGMQLMGKKDALNTFRISIIAHLVLNVFICVLIWIKSKFATVIAMIFSLVQCGWWGLCAGVWRTQFAGGNFLYSVRVGMGLWGYVDAAVIIFVLCILILIFDKNKKAKKVKKVKNATSHISPEVKEGMLVCVSGEYVGANVVVGENPILLGRDKEKCQLIFSSEKISRVHCSVAYDQEKAMYKVRDLSTNGTFLGKMYADDKRMERNVDVLLQPGTFISISREDCFELV